ncbi:tRNA methyltransferase complex GCD14 subunit-domain-containing protein [Vararia minispora EC-137]|uniref:tRNA methyltransferase complex GCD14 subunit-domain-containing protein n=1 Tax=Vararia minispora EC-137 TaxID=1314806 RepID=A0ACB8QMG1_9AGAM|nr:tRNA methyltransferase complex GCD14 subunit-domain-containing protein [Vararia minispora EC-137]
MWSSSNKIAAGDVVITWLTRDVIQPFVVTPGKDLNSRYGYYRHSDLIGQPYGSKIGSRNGKGFIHILRPTPELWTLALPHRTQILYLADIAFITSWLNIRPGSVVVEAGTGSGSFTHSITRTVGRNGKVFSYEFHEARAAKARDEFETHGMSDVVTLTHRNVCKDGFTVENVADAVFLDLPAPWDAIDHAKSALRKDRTARICCFSPCMEQVLRTVTSLNETGFTDITMYETLIRPHEVNQLPVLPSIAVASEKLKKSERKREDKRLRQIAQARAKHTEKRKRSDDEGADAEEDRMERKKTKTRNGTDEGEATTQNAWVSATTPDSLAGGDASTQVVSRVMPEVRGHTSFLTFAVLLPRVQASAPDIESALQRDRSDLSSGLSQCD